MYVACRGMHVDLVSVSGGWMWVGSSACLDKRRYSLHCHTHIVQVQLSLQSVNPSLRQRMQLHPHRVLWVCTQLKPPTHEEALHTMKT